MEDEMNVHNINSATSVDQLVQLIDTLYNSKNPDDQTEANRRLTELQSSEPIWDLCWPLLDPNRFNSIEVHFFAANTLVLKLNQSWSQQDPVWLEKHLRPRLFETLVSYASSPNGGKLVVERLALALATFALHSIPTFWPDAIENILQTVTPRNLPVTISPQRICDILLKILMYIPEEYAVLMPNLENRAKLNQQMTKAGPIVFKFLHSLLVADINTLDSDCKQSVLKCMTSWTMHSQTSLLEMDDGRPILDLLYDLILDEDLCCLACSALAATYSSHKADNFRNAVIDFIPKLAQLEYILDKYKSEDNMECVIRIYSLVINFSENHSRLLLKIVLKDGSTLEGEREERVKQSIFTIIRIILDCTSASGIYGVEEKYSDTSFTFWFTFFESFSYYSDSFNNVICETFDPLVDSLLGALIRKSQYPPSSIYYKLWNDDQRESYRCYRQDLGDNISLIVQFPRSRERIFARLHELMVHAFSRMVQSGDSETSWQEFESVVFALKSIAESVPFDEAEQVPKIFAIISQVPFNESHALLYCTVAEMISSYSDWLFTHNTHLAIAFNVLFLGVTSPDPHVRLMSTLSLKDLTLECQTVLQPFASQIVKSCSDAILRPNSNLTTNEKSRLMYTVGTTLAVSPVQTIQQALSTLTLPLISELSAVLQQDPTLNPTARFVVLDHLTLLNSLIESLYVKQYSGNDYECDENDREPRAYDPARYEPIENTDTVQPALGLLRQLIPMINATASKYQADEDIIDIIANTIKRSAKSLGIELKPILNELMMIIVAAYDPMVGSGILDGSQPLYLLFRADYTVHPILVNAFASISEKTLEVCLGHPLRQLSLTIENYFRFATLVCKRMLNFVDLTTSFNLEYIYKLAIASLELPEKRTLAEVCNFLTHFRQRSGGHEQLGKIFRSHLDLMLANIFNILGGTYSTPRNAIDHVTDLLFALVDMDEIHSPLKLIVEKDNFPTSFISRDEKARFVSKVMHEKNRRKFKDACNQFVLSARNLNRSVIGRVVTLCDC